MPNSTLVPKMPAVPTDVGGTIHRVLDTYRGRIDQMAMVNRSAQGDVVIQVPPVSAPGGLTFPYDRLTLRVDGSNGLNGAVELPIRTVTADCSLLATDFALYGDATAGLIKVYLPVPNLSTGRVYVIKKTDGSGNAVQVFGHNLLDGGSSKPLTTQYDAITVQSDGLKWYIIGIYRTSL